MPEIDPRLKKILKNVLKQLNPENDIEYMRYASISDRIANIERVLTQPKPDSKKKERAPRVEQLTKERCKAVARFLWKENPRYTIADLSIHPAIYNNDITGGSNYEPRTVSDWIAEADTRSKDSKVGRPPKLTKQK